MEKHPCELLALQPKRCTRIGITPSTRLRITASGSILTTIDARFCEFKGLTLWKGEGFRPQYFPCECERTDGGGLVTTLADKNTLSHLSGDFTCYLFFAGRKWQMECQAFNAAIGESDSPLASLLGKLSGIRYSWPNCSAAAAADGVLELVNGALEVLVEPLTAKD